MLIVPLDGPLMDEVQQGTMQHVRLIVLKLWYHYVAHLRHGVKILKLIQYFYICILNNWGLTEDVPCGMSNMIETDV